MAKNVRRHALKKNVDIPKPVAERMSIYLRELKAFKCTGMETVSSEKLGTPLGITSSQVRKDLAYFGQFGSPGLGYNVVSLIDAVKKIIGIDKEWRVALVGCGNLGSALAKFKGFAASGFRIAAIFDNQKSKVGTNRGDFVILDLDDLPRVVREKKIQLGIIAVPAFAAVEVADKMVDAGIQGIINFAAVNIEAPPGVIIQGVDFAVQMKQLIFNLVSR